MVIARGTVVPPLVSPGMLSIVISPVTTAADAGSTSIAVPALGPSVVSTVHSTLSKVGTVFIWPATEVLLSDVWMAACIVASVTRRVAAVATPR